MEGYVAEGKWQHLPVKYGVGKRIPNDRQSMEEFFASKGHPMDLSDREGETTMEGILQEFGLNWWYTANFHGFETFETHVLPIYDWFTQKFAKNYGHVLSIVREWDPQYILDTYGIDEKDIKDGEFQMRFYDILRDEVFLPFFNDIHQEIGVKKFYIMMEVNKMDNGNLQGHCEISWPEFADMNELAVNLETGAPVLDENNKQKTISQVCQDLINLWRTTIGEMYTTILFGANFNASQELSVHPI